MRAVQRAVPSTRVALGVDSLQSGWVSKCMRNQTNMPARGSCSCYSCVLVMMPQSASAARTGVPCLSWKAPSTRMVHMRPMRRSYWPRRPSSQRTQPSIFQPRKAARSRGVASDPIGRLGRRRLRAQHQLRDHRLHEPRRLLRARLGDAHVALDQVRLRRDPAQRQPGATVLEKVSSRTTQAVPCRRSGTTAPSSRGTDSPTTSAARASQPAAAAAGSSTPPPPAPPTGTADTSTGHPRQ